MDTKTKMLCDVDFVHKVMSDSTSDKNLSEYKLCYVSNADNMRFIKIHIEKFIREVLAKTVNKDDAIVFKEFRHKDDDYIFCFVKKMYLNNNALDTGASLQKYNPILEYRIATVGYGKRMNINNYALYNIEVSKRTFFVDAYDNLQSLNFLPIAKGVLKDEAFNKKTFLQCFMNARNEYGFAINLMRKMNGNKFCIYCSILPNFINLVGDCKTINAKINFQKMINEIISGIRLNIDQVKNACEEFKILGVDGTSSELCDSNHSYINKSNRFSFCIVGDSRFNFAQMQNDYERLFNFGNVYSLELLMYLPSSKNLDYLINAYQKYIDILGETSFSTQERMEAIKKLNFEYKFQMNKACYAQMQYLYKYFHCVQKFNENGFYSKDEKDDFIKNLQQFRRFKEIRMRMDCKDIENGEADYCMKNVWDMGYDLEMRDIFKNRYGMIGEKLYDRFYALQFAKYILAVYKPTGSLFDLTYLSDKFFESENEISVFEKNTHTEEERKLLNSYFENAKIEDYLAIVQRFNGILNIRKIGNRLDGKSNRNFQYLLTDELLEPINDIVTNWDINEFGRDINSLCYAERDVHKFSQRDRIRVLKAKLDEANILNRVDKNTNFDEINHKGNTSDGVDDPVSM